MFDTNKKGAFEPLFYLRVQNYFNGAEIGNY